MLRFQVCFILDKYQFIQDIFIFFRFSNKFTSFLKIGHLQDAGVDESDWFLLPYQKGKGLPQTIVGHIREGIKIAANDPNSLLIFSGGETRFVNFLSLQQT